MKYDQAFAKVTKNQIHLNMQFQVQPHILCQLSPMLRECGGTHFYSRLIDDDLVKLPDELFINSQTINIEEFGNYTYLISVRAIVLDDSPQMQFDKYRPEIDLVVGNDEDQNNFNFHPPL